MSTLDQLAAKLAEATVAAMKETGDDRLYVEVGQVLSASSQSLEEAFLTEVRLRMTAETGHKFLARKLSGLRAKTKPAAAPPPTRPRPPTRRE